MSYRDREFKLPPIIGQPNPPYQKPQKQVYFDRTRDCVRGNHEFKPIAQAIKNNPHRKVVETLSQCSICGCLKSSSGQMYVQSGRWAYEIKRKKLKVVLPPRQI